MERGSVCGSESWAVKRTSGLLHLILHHVRAPQSRGSCGRSRAGPTDTRHDPAGWTIAARIHFRRLRGTQGSRLRSPWQNGVAELWVGSCRRDKHMQLRGASIFLTPQFAQPLLTNSYCWGMNVPFGLPVPVLLLLWNVFVVPPELFTIPVPLSKSASAVMLATEVTPDPPACIPILLCALVESDTSRSEGPAVTASERRPTELFPETSLCLTDILLKSSEAIPN